MFAALLLACTIQMFSIFAFFGNAINYYVSPSMFDLMFGNSVWKQYGGMTFLFVWQIVLMVLALGGYICCINVKCNDGDIEEGGSSIGGLGIIMSLVSTIVSFCTLPIIGLDGSGISLGAGPVIYSVLHIVAIIVLIIGFIYQNYERNNVMTPNDPRLFAANNYVKTEERKSENKPMTEAEKADLILKYKSLFDQGILTQEEFEAKKKQLLQ